MLKQTGRADALLEDPVSLGEEAGLDLDWNQGATDISQATFSGPEFDSIPFIQTTARTPEEVPYTMNELIGLGQFENLPPIDLTERL